MRTLLTAAKVATISAAAGNTNVPIAFAEKFSEAVQVIGHAEFDAWNNNNNNNINHTLALPLWPGILRSVLA